MTTDDLVERRRKYIERQIALDKSAVNVAFAGRTPEGTGPRNRHGMPQLPVGQHAGEELARARSRRTARGRRSTTWKLEIAGLVENPFTLTWDQFLALPQAEDVSDFHCVTTWSRYDNHWGGVAFGTIAELAVPKPEAKFILCTGYDFMPGSRIPYTVNLPLARALDEDVLLVHTWEGKPLPREHGGPCRMITPKLYAWKGAKWIRKIEFLAEDKKGFWERARLLEFRRALVQRSLLDGVTATARRCEGHASHAVGRSRMRRTTRAISRSCSYFDFELPYRFGSNR